MPFVCAGLWVRLWLRGSARFVLYRLALGGPRGANNTKGTGDTDEDDGTDNADTGCERGRIGRNTVEEEEDDDNRGVP